MQNNAKEAWKRTAARERAICFESFVLLCSASGARRPKHSSIENTAEEFASLFETAAFWENVMVLEWGLHYLERAC